MKNKTIIIGIIVLIVFIAMIIGMIYIISLNFKNNISKDIIEKMKNGVNTGDFKITKEYLDINISRVTKETATEMVTLYEQYQDNNIEKLHNEFKTEILQYSGEYTIDTLNNIENINEGNLKNVLIEIRNNGYKLKAIWGDIIVVKDYSQFAEYEKYVSGDKKAYIEIQNEYEKQLYSYENINSLLNAIIKTENSINSINDNLIREQAYNVYINMIMIMVEGDEMYVPGVYGEENNRARISEIQKNIDQNPNTVTSKILNKYIVALKEDEYEYMNKCIEFKNDIANNIKIYFN